MGFTYYLKIYATKLILHNFWQSEALNIHFQLFSGYMGLGVLQLYKNKQVHYANIFSENCLEVFKFQCFLDPQIVRLIISLTIPATVYLFIISTALLLINLSDPAFYPALCYYLFCMFTSQLFPQNSKFLKVRKYNYITISDSFYI